jgi:flotillin
LDLLAEMLPRLVKEAAAPLGAIDKVTVISTDGASAMTRNVAGNVTQGMQLASDLLGLDLQALFRRLAAGEGLEADGAPRSAEQGALGGASG